MALVRYDLPYQQDSSVLFERLLHLDCPILLDSGQALKMTDAKQNKTGERYDILVANPVIRVESHGSETMVWRDGQWTATQADPFDLLKEYLNQYPQSSQEHLPFVGGWLGYWSYDLARRIERLPTHAHKDNTLPELSVGLYDWAVVVDHELQQTHLVSHMHFATEHHLKEIFALLTGSDASKTIDTFEVTGEVLSNFTPDAYRLAFEKVQAYIRAGDCYQINLAQRFSVPVFGDAWIAYKQFKTLSQAPFMAYIDFVDAKGKPFQILSMSPERFLQVMDGVVETRPIKGTRPRSTNSTQDARNAQDLITSPKDKAENLMIVDLLRNDIGKVCELGSVKVTELFKLQSFANVHHMVSIIVGRLAAQYHVVDLLKSCFPGGSITGAPKLRAMQIIDELEPHRRGVYCGCIGYIGFDGAMDTNIAIRTALINQQTMTFYAGGGIVADSDCEKEYQETLDKASHFMKLITQLKRK